MPVHQMLEGNSPMVRSVPAASKCSASNPRASSACLAFVSSHEPLLPRRHGVVGVEPAHVHHLLPQLLERRVGFEVGIHLGRPAGGRRRHDRPVRQPLGEVSDSLLGRRRPIASQPVAVEPRQHAGLGRVRRARSWRRGYRPARAPERAPSPGPYPSVSSIPCSIRARLIHGSPYSTLTWRAPAR